MNFKAFIQQYNGDFNNKDLILSSFLKVVDDESDLIQQKQLSVLLNCFNFIAELKRGYDNARSKNNLELFLDDIEKVCSAFDANKIPAQIYAYFCYCALIKINPKTPCDEIKWIDPREYDLNPNKVSSSATFGLGAYKESPNDFAFNGAELVNVKVDREIITIPNGVKSISATALRGLKNVKLISVPNSVNALPASIFTGLSSLECVFLSNKITEIPNNAFRKCINLGNVVASAVKSIGDYAFEETKIVNLKRCGGENITKVGSLAFKNCQNLKAISLPNAVVDRGAFAGCNNLVALRINPSKDLRNLNALFSEDGITPAQTAIKELYLTFANGEIPDGFFANSSIEKIVIGGEVKAIGESAFANCLKLAEVQASFKAPAIKNKAFNKCESLKALSSFDNVSEIGESAFEGCKSLVALTINGAVNKIGKAAFANCDSLTTLNINYVGNVLPELCFAGSNQLNILPFFKNVEILEARSYTGKLEITSFNFWDKLKVVKAFAFEQCESKIENLYIPARIKFEKQALVGLKPTNLVFENANIQDEQGNNIPPYALFSASLEEFVRDYDKLNGVGVLNGVVPPECFKGWSNIEKVHFTQKITVIPKGCFEDCINLEAVKIDAPSVKFEDRAFYNCKKLVRLIVGDVNVIDGGRLTLGSISGLGQDTLFGCAGINEIVAENNTLTPLMFSEFNGVKKVRLSLNDPENISFGFYYLFANTLEEFNSRFTSLKELEIVSKGMIPDSFFKGCLNIEVINIQGQIDKIKDYAFMQCSNLKELNLNYVGNEVPTNCFMDCKALTQLTLPNVEIVGASAFKNCISLSHLVLSRNVSQIEEKAFKNCVGLTAIPFGITANNIGNEAFMGMSKIKELSLSNVGRIGEGAFSSCGELNTISLKNVHHLEPLIFNGCNKITAFDLELAEDYEGNTRFYQLFESDVAEFNRIYKAFNEITITVRGILPAYFFESISTVKKIIINGDVKEIGEGVFKDCNELEEISINYLGNSLSKNLFLNCKKLTRGLSFPSVDQIGESAFEGCEALDNVTFAPQVRAVEDKAFKGCLSLKSVPFPICPEKIGAEAFMNCNKFTDLNIVGANSVGEKAFFGIPRFNSVALEQLPDDAILSTIIDPESVIKEINYFSGVVTPSFFEGMNKLEKVVLPEMDVKICNNAFSKCSALKEIVNLNKVKYLGNECLSDCPIESLTISEDASFIGTSILKGCSLLKEITLPLLDRTFGSLFSSFEFDGSIEVIHIVDGAEKSYFIPKSLKNININSIKPCPGALSSLKDIAIQFNCVVSELPNSFLRNTNGNIAFDHPDKIKVVNEYALSETNIGDIDLESAEEIKDYAFMNCRNIKKATFYSSLLNLSKNAFEGTNLEELHIIDNDNFICECGFTVSKNSNEIIFVDKDIEGDVVVPDAVYEISTLLKGKKNITSIDLNQVTSIADEAFADCSSLTSLKMSKDVISIGNNILKGVPSLEKLVIAFVGADENTPSPLSYLNDKGFKVDNLTILKGQIAPNFANKQAFNKVDLSKMDNLELPNDAFVECSIEEINLPNGTLLNGDTVFNDTNIKVFNSDIPHDDNFIYYNDSIYMCYNPEGVSSVTINENIKGLTSQSFRGIKELDKLDIYVENLPLEQAFVKIAIKEIALADVNMDKLSEQFAGSFKTLRKFTCPATSLPIDFFKGFTALEELYLDELEAFGLNFSVNSLKVLSLDNLKEIDKDLAKISYEKLSIGDDLEAIDYDAFKNLKADSLVIGDNENFYQDQGMFIDKKNSTVFASLKDCKGDIVIPDFVETIYSDAFRTRDITSIDTNNVINIKENAFRNCSSLEKVIIGEKATNIASGAFALANVKKMKLAALPANLSGVAALFEGRNIPLEKVIITNEKIYRRNYFAGLRYAKIIVISNKATTIESNAFNGCESLIKFVLPQSVEKIEAKAFNGCLGIEYEDSNGKKKKVKKGGLTLIVKDKEQLAKFDKNFDLVQSILFKKVKLNITTEGWEESNYEL